MDHLDIEQLIALADAADHLCATTAAPRFTTSEMDIAHTAALNVGEQAIAELCRRPIADSDFYICNLKQRLCGGSCQGITSRFCFGSSRVGWIVKIELVSATHTIAGERWQGAL